MLAQEKQAAIINFLPKLQEQVNKDYSAFMPSHIDWAPKLSYSEGKRFVKIVSESGHGGAKSVFGFIEKETGLLWKAAGWKAPALNFPRGNIADADISRVRWTGIS